MPVKYVQAQGKQAKIDNEGKATRHQVTQKLPHQGLARKLVTNRFYLINKHAVVNVTNLGQI